jgi:hypothetical protein
MASSYDVVFWALAGIQLFGLAACMATRLVEETRAAWPLRQTFFVGLVAVCTATITALYLGSPCWVSCGATFCIMSVGATIDLRGRIEPSAF